MYTPGHVLKVVLTNVAQFLILILIVNLFVLCGAYTFKLLIWL
jgi:hypothetical protein